MLAPMRTKLGWLLALPLLIPTEAQARGSAKRALNGGVFIYGSPGPVAIPVDEDNSIFPRLRSSWQGAFGAGYLFAPGRNFKIAAGGAIEHWLYNFSAGHRGVLFRIMPSARIGGGNEVIWGYGKAGAGPAFSHVNYNVPVRGFDDRDTDVGFAFETGGGVQAMVWRGLMLGGEVDYDLAFFGNDGPNYRTGAISLSFILGWYF